MKWITKVRGVYIIANNLNDFIMKIEEELYDRERVLG